MIDICQTRVFSKTPEMSSCGQLPINITSICDHKPLSPLVLMLGTVVCPPDDSDSSIRVPLVEAPVIEQHDPYAARTVHPMDTTVISGSRQRGTRNVRCGFECRCACDVGHGIRQTWVRMRENGLKEKRMVRRIYQRKRERRTRRRERG